MADFTIDAECRSWPIVRPWLEDACEHGDGWWTIQKLMELLCNGRAVLWVLSEGQEAKAAVVSAVADWDGVLVAEMVAQGGSGINAALGEHINKVEDWARSKGASEVVFRGRRGLSRVYKPFGYEEIAVTMRKVL